jgi:hypothetical protein
MGTQVPPAAGVGQLARKAAHGAWRVLALLARRRLHLPRGRLGTWVTLADGRRFLVFRESVCDEARSPAPAVVVVWFRLRLVPPGARVRRWLFERLCLVNTLLFAGYDGFSVKLWMVDPATSDYAGLYTWGNDEDARRYVTYITSILTPLSVAGSVGGQVVPDGTLEQYLDSAPEDSATG